MTCSDQSKHIEDILQDLREDGAMLRAVLLEARAPVDQLTLDCLLRISDYLTQHIQDVEMLVEQNKKTR